MDYPQLRRTLKIQYKKFFPYEILAWEEIQTKSNGDQEVTKATRRSLNMLDYWNKNEKLFEPLRNDLGIEK